MYFCAVHVGCTCRVFDDELVDAVRPPPDAGAAEGEAQTRGSGCLFSEGLLQIPSSLHIALSPGLFFFLGFFFFSFFFGNSGTCVSSHTSAANLLFTQSIS